MNTRDRFVRNHSFALAPAEDGYLAYDIETRHLHRLNASAALIIELCDGSRPLEEIYKSVAPFFETSGSNTSECFQWIEVAIKEGMLRPHDQPQITPQAEHFSKVARKLRKEGYVLAAFVCQHHATLQR